jgi:ABC-type multidrug transport system ATPase subunit
VRLGFAVAAFLDPEILLVDEVLAVGDAGFQERCYEHIEGLRDRGVTVVMVSHDLAAVERFATRAALMERGRIVMVGEPADILGEHLGRLATSSPEIQRALDEAMEEQRGAIEELIERSPEARARFERALERNPEFMRRMEEQQRAQAEAGERPE